jgi:hypothetical protein
LQKPTDAPEYVSHDEWLAKKARIRWRRSVSGILIGFSIAAAILVGVFRERFTLARNEQALISSIDSLWLYQVHTIAIDRATKLMRPLREENHQGADFQISLWGGKILLTKNGGGYSTYESGSNLLFKQGSWYGSADCLHRVRSALVEADPWQKGQTRFSELPDVAGHRRYQVSFDDARYEVQVDDRSRPIWVTLFRFTDDGWAATEVSQVTYDNEPFVYPGRPGEQKMDLTGTDPWDHLFSEDVKQVDLGNGFVTRIRASAANPDGTVFLLADGLAAPATIKATSSDGSRYAASLVRINPPASETGGSYNAIMVARADSKPVHWPINLNIEIFNPNNHKLGNLKTTAPGPDCDPIPYWFCSAAASDQPFFDYYCRENKLLGDYYSTLYYKNGKPQTVAGPEFNGAYKWTSADRRKGLEYELASLDSYFQGPPAFNNPADDSYLGEAWFFVYLDRSAVERTRLGLPNDDALRALRLAQQAMHRNDYRGPVATKIAAAMAAEAPYGRPTQ